MDDRTIRALCVWSEAAGELAEGRRAVALVIEYRIKAKYESDGTAGGTVLAYDQFSGFWFAMFNQQYRRVCWTLADAQKRADQLLRLAMNEPIWADCLKAVDEVDSRAWSFAPGPQFDALLAHPRTFMYANLAISSPAWAFTYPQVAKIGHHTFFEVPLPKG